jgi:hypothetical protein
MSTYEKGRPEATSSVPDSATDCSDKLARQRLASRERKAAIEGERQIRHTVRVRNEHSPFGDVLSDKGNARKDLADSGLHPIGQPHYDPQATSEAPRVLRSRGDGRITLGHGKGMRVTLAEQFFGGYDGNLDEWVASPDALASMKRKRDEAVFRKIAATGYKGMGYSEYGEFLRRYLPNLKELYLAERAEHAGRRDVGLPPIHGPYTAIVRNYMAMRNHELRLTVEAIEDYLESQKTTAERQATYRKMVSGADPRKSARQLAREWAPNGPSRRTIDRIRRELGIKDG